jgi:hypothetical protein
VVSGGSSMNEAIISEAQDYLTVRRDEEYKRIVDIQNLLQNHTIKEVTGFLRDYLRGKEKALRNLILIDKTHQRIEKYVGAMFRITMAINILEREEVNIIERSEQGTEKSCKFQKWNSSGNFRSRFRKDKNYDGEDRIPRYASQRHA